MFGVFPLGEIIAVCELVWVREIGQFDWAMNSPDWRIGNRVWYTSPQEKAFGDFTPGRFAWFLDNIKPLPKPIPCSGAMGIWDWDGDIV